MYVFISVHFPYRHTGSANYVIGGVEKPDNELQMCKQYAISPCDRQIDRVYKCIYIDIYKNMYIYIDKQKITYTPWEPLCKWSSQYKAILKFAISTCDTAFSNFCFTRISYANIPGRCGCDSCDITHMPARLTPKYNLLCENVDNLIPGDQFGLASDTWQRK